MSENIKNAIEDEKINIVCFKIFHTALLYNFENEKNLWLLLDEEYEKKTNSNICFSKLRELAQKDLAADCNGFDIYEIYQYMVGTFHIEPDVAEALLKMEIEYIRQNSSRRQYVYEIYKHALSLAKRIIFVEDTELGCDVIEKMLTVNGYHTYDKVYLTSQKMGKGTELFSNLLTREKVNADEVLWLGDDKALYNTLTAQMGIKCYEIPFTLYNFENREEAIPINAKGMVGRYCAGINKDYVQARETAGFSTMMLMIANKFYDRPIYERKQQRRINQSTEFIGYYYMGMHLLGIISWIRSQITTKYNRIVFTARDGFLIKKAYDMYREYMTDLPESVYVYVSRLALLPVMLKKRIDFFDLPLQWKLYSPKLCIELLDFCADDMVDCRGIIEAHGLKYECTFESQKQYHFFINLFYDEIYSARKHEDAKSMCRRYLSVLNEKDIIFDIGYSGRIQKAICDAVDFPLDVLFMYSDSGRCAQNSRKGLFDIRTFYNEMPVAPGVFREYLLSETTPTCIGYEEGLGGKVQPVFDIQRDKSGAEIVDDIQRHALEFVSDYLKHFGAKFEYLYFKPQEVSYPFEAFIREPYDMDELLEKCEYEDKIYGATLATNVRDFLHRHWKNNEARNHGILLFKKEDCLYNRCSMLKKKIVIFGTGRISSAFSKKRKWLSIEYYLDNDRSKEGHIFEGHEIVHPDNIKNKSNIFIIIAVKDKNDIAMQLMQMGYIEGNDFIHYTEFNDL